LKVLDTAGQGVTRWYRQIDDSPGRTGSRSRVGWRRPLAPTTSATASVCSSFRSVLLRSKPSLNACPNSRDHLTPSARRSAKSADNRLGGIWPCPQPHAGAGTPELCPHRL